MVVSTLLMIQYRPIAAGSPKQIHMEKRGMTRFITFICVCCSWPLVFCMMIVLTYWASAEMIGIRMTPTQAQVRVKLLNMLEGWALRSRPRKEKSTLMRPSTLPSKSAQCWEMKSVR